MRTFGELAASAAPPLDRLALALAAEFRDVDEEAVLGTLDALAEDLAEARTREGGTPASDAAACGRVLGGTHGFTGATREYDAPENSMLDLVLERRRGLPILLSVVYVEVARRAGVALAPIGLPGHFVVGHVGADPPLLLDPFTGGGPLTGEAPAGLVRPWGAHETAMRMLNNLVGSLERRGDLGGAIHAADLRLLLPADDALRATLEAERAGLVARLN